MSAEDKQIRREKISLYSEWLWRAVCLGLLVAGIWLYQNMTAGNMTTLTNAIVAYETALGRQ